jgi:hypothetical protein
MREKSWERVPSQARKKMESGLQALHLISKIDDTDTSI